MDRPPVLPADPRLRKVLEDAFAEGNVIEGEHGPEILMPGEWLTEYHRLQEQLYHDTFYATAERLRETWRGWLLRLWHDIADPLW